MQKSYDLAIIGAGCVGSLTARLLCRYDLRIALLEKGSDPASGATRANSAIVHAGFDAKPGSRKAELNLRGAALMPALCAALHVPFRRNGAVVVGFSEDDLSTLQTLLERGQQNGVRPLWLMNREELLAMEPEVNPEATGALFAPTSGICSPYELAIAATECAVRNGVDLYREFEVDRIDSVTDGFAIAAEDQQVQARYMINAAGVHSDDIAALVGDTSFAIQARRGEYLLLDSAKPGVSDRTLFQCPSPMGKGVLITPTVHGNILMGPTAVDVDDKDDVSTTVEGLQEIEHVIARTVPNYKVSGVITTFAGMRAHSDRDDFILEASAVQPRMLHAAGIESPGLTASPAIAEQMEQLFAAAYDGELTPRDNWQPGRDCPLRMQDLTPDEQALAIAKNPAYGRIVCRCEQISEGEILDAIHAPAGARDVDGVKRRVRAGAGRCQGGFCGAKVLRLLSRELGRMLEEVTLHGGDSRILEGPTK